MNNDNKPSERRMPAFVFAGFAVFYILLRSKDLFTVDGAYTCLEVYHLQRILLDINNHLLYFVDVFAWTHLLGALGFVARTPLEFFATVEVMNCFAGAGALAIFCHFLYLATSSWWQALGGTIAYGLCKAFIAQATNANQPMVAIFWSFLALWFAVLSAQRRSLWPICISGALFSLAMATYQSTIFLVPVAVLFLWYGGVRTSWHVRPTARQFVRLGAFVLAGLATAVVVYGWAYPRMGISGVPAMVHHFFWHEESRVYLTMSVGKLLNIPVGMLRNIFPLLPFFNGIRGLLARRGFALWTFLVAAAAFFVFLASCVLWISKRWADLQPRQRIALSAAAMGFVFTMALVVVYDPQYDKLWIQPLACLAVLVVVALSVIAHDSRTSLLLARIATILILAGVATNLVRVVQGRSHYPYELDEARQLATIIGGQGLLVGDWDHVSVLYGALWSSDGQYFSFPTEAQRNGIKAESDLHQLISQAIQKNRRVYFLSILDESKATWDSFLGSRCGVPYSALDTYREHSSILTTFKTRYGDVALREFDLRSFN